MPAFRYSAIDAAGKVRHGVMEAPSEAFVVNRLQREGSIPMRADPAERGGFLADLLARDFGRGSALGKQEVANATRELAIMLAAGQDLDRSLRFLTETAPSARVRRVMDQLRNAVRDGAPLSVALGAHPRSFPRLYVGLVRAGEAGGRLAETLHHLADLLETERSLATTVKSALIYPALLIVAAIGSITLLLTEVLPQFVPLFEQNGAALPGSTQFLIDAGAFVARDGIYLLIVAGGLFVALRMLLRRPRPRLVMDRMLLRVPIFGTLLREMLAARFTRTLGTLMVNGVPLIGALAIVRDVIGNRVAVEAVDQASVSAKGGAGLARPLDQSGIFPRRMIYLLRLGEENAQIGPIALRAAEIHEQKTRTGVQRLVSLLVPVITIVMGAAVAGIVSSLLLAMLSLNDLAN